MGLKIKYVYLQIGLYLLDSLFVGYISHSTANGSIYLRLLVYSKFQRWSRRPSCFFYSIRCPNPFLGREHDLCRIIRIETVSPKLHPRPRFLEIKSFYILFISYRKRPSPPPGCRFKMDPRMGCPVSLPTHDFDPDSGIDAVSNVLQGRQDPGPQPAVGVILI